MPGARIAFIDESVHHSVGIYVVASVIVDGSTALDFDALEELVPAHRAPHWHSEDAKTRLSLVDFVARMPVEVRAYACRFATQRRQEAARARALTWLVSELPADVARLVVESRHHRQDAKDLAVLASASRGRWIEFSHVPGKGKRMPELWLADIAAGALAARFAGGTDYRAHISAVLTRFECE